MEILSELASIPILDHHCHAFLNRATPYTPLELQRFFSEGGDDKIAAEHTPNSVYFRWAVKELANFLGCPPTTEAVLAARSAIPLDEVLEQFVAKIVGSFAVQERRLSYNRYQFRLEAFVLKQLHP